MEWHEPNLAPAVAEALQNGKDELGDIANSPAMKSYSMELQDLSEAAKVASDVIQMMETATNTELTGEDLPYPAHEIRGLVKALQTFRGELMNNLARLTELDEKGPVLDKDIAKEQQKLDEAKERGGVDEETRRNIAEHLCQLKEQRASIRNERASHLKAAVGN